MGWENRKELNSGYFRISKSNNSNVTLDYYLNKIDLDSYWVYKASGRFRRVEVEDIGKYANYIFFKKDLYCIDFIDKWIEEIYKIQSMPFLNKSFPRIEILKKIEAI